MSLFMTPRQVAEQWECSPEHVQRLCKRGELAAMKLARRGWRISPAAVEAYEAAHTSATPATANETPKPEASRREEVQRPVTTVGGFTLPADYEPVFKDLWPFHETKKSASRG